jgi:hypothetical protein
MPVPRRGLRRSVADRNRIPIVFVSLYETLPESSGSDVRDWRRHGRDQREIDGMILSSGHIEVHS